MSEPKKRGSEWPIWMGVALVMLAAYGGAYSAIVTPDMPVNGGIKIIPGVPKMLVAPRPGYFHSRGSSPPLDAFFWPANQVDRLLRPERWAPRPFP